MLITARRNLDAARATADEQAASAAEVERSIGAGLRVAHANLSDALAAAPTETTPALNLRLREHFAGVIVSQDGSTVQLWRLVVPAATMPQITTSAAELLTDKLAVALDPRDGGSARRRPLGPPSPSGPTGAEPGTGPKPI